MKWKVVVAILAAIVIASTLIGYYLESQSPSQQSSEPTLTYDFTSTAAVDFLGWNFSGYVSNNETNAATIHTGGVLSRQFKTLGPKVTVSLNWTISAVMVIGRRYKGNYENLTPFIYSSENSLSYTNVTSFDADNGTTFMMQFEALPTVFPITIVIGVELWNCAEVP